MKKKNVQGVTVRRNVQDATLKNIRVLKKELAKLTTRVKRLENKK